jgi:mono/diheme cytochrome c family protein
MSSGIRLALLAAAGFVLTLAAPAYAQQSPTVKRAPIKPISDVSGTASYREYCTVCHGIAGRGDGPAAKALVKPPSDLTQIAKRNNGKFPALAVRMHVTGDTVVAAHGTRDMPMWGSVFHDTEDSSTAVLRLRNLVDYIEALQEK